MSSNKCLRALICALCAALLLSAAACGSRETAGEAMLLGDGEGAAQNTYVTRPAVADDLYKTVTFSADVNFSEIATVTCGELAGAKLVKLLVKKNQEVKKGEAIAEFRMDYSQAELDGLYADLEIRALQYRGGLKNYESRLAAAKAGYAAAQPGSDQQALKAIDLKRAQDSYDSFVRNQGQGLADMQKRIDDFEERIARTTVLSPQDGVVYSVANLEEGTLVSDDTVLCVLYNPDTAFLSVNSSVDNGYRWNREVTISNAFYEGGDVFPGRVLSAPDVTEDTTGMVVIMPDDPQVLETIFRSRAQSYVVMRYTLCSVLVIPRDALRDEQNDYYVNIIEDGTVKKRYVTIGASGKSETDDTDIVQILDGIREGDLVMMD